MKNWGLKTSARLCRTSAMVLSWTTSEWKNSSDEYRIATTIAFIMQCIYCYASSSNLLAEFHGLARGYLRSTTAKTHTCLTGFGFKNELIVS
jgi:hypothetical protein